MKRKMISCVFCQSNRELWCLDIQIHALCKVNMENLQAECKISPMEIWEGGICEVIKLVVWGDKILILPARLDQRWGIYDKNTGNLEYANFCKESYRPVEAFLIGNRLTMIPVFANDPIIIIDLQKRKIITRQYLQVSHFIPNGEMEIWQAKAEHEKICFLIRDTCYYGQIKEEKASLVRIHAPEPLRCADFCENGGWAIGSYGKCLYQFDEEGNLLESVYIELKTEVVKMIVKPQYIFLIPAEGAGMWIYDRNSKQVKKCVTEMGENEIILPSLLKTPAYWSYVEKEHTIWFLPWRYSLQIMDTDTLLCQQRVITYTDSFSQEKYWNYFNYVNFIRMVKKQFFIYENSCKGIEGYLEFIKKYNCVSKNESRFCGEAIWKTMVEMNYGEKRE